MRLIRYFLAVAVVAFAQFPVAAQEPVPLELVLQTTWHGDGIPVPSVSLTSDGKYAVTGGRQTAILWDSTTGKRLRTFEGHTNGITGVAVSGDGKHVVTASYDGTAILWEAASGKKLHTFPQDATESKTPPPYGTARIYDMALSADGNYLVTGSWQTATLWEVKTGKKLRTLQAYDSWVERVAVSGDGKYVVTAPWDKTATLWESATGKKLQTFQGVANDRFTCVAMSSDGKQVVTVGHHRFSDGKQVLVAASRMVVVWDSATGKKLQSFVGHAGAISGVALTSDGKHVLTASSWDSTAILWETETGKQIRTFEGHTGGIRTLALSGDGRRVITGSQDHSAIMWDVASGRKLQTLRGSADKVYALALSGNGKSLAVAGTGASLWNLADGKKTGTFRGKKAHVQTVALSGDGKYVIAGSKDEEAILWDADSGKQLRTFPGYDGYFRPMVCVALTADAQRAVIVSLEKAHLWDAAQGKQLRTVTHSKYGRDWGLSARWNSVALSRDGKLLALGGTHETATLWNPASGEKLQSLGHAGRVWSVALSGDGKRALTGSEDKTAIVWDAASGQKLQTFTHASSVKSVALSSDGKYAVTAGGKAFLWDSTTGKKLHTFEGHTDGITGVALSDDGQHLWTVSEDRTTRLWDTATGKERCRLYSLNAGDDWLVVTPDGRFDGSKDAWRFVAYREPGTLKLFDDDATLKRFHRPGLLAEVWKGNQ